MMGGTGVKELGEALGIRLEKLTIEQKSAPANRVRALYNPQSLQLQIGAEYAAERAVGSTSDTLNFKGMKYGDLVLELILDASRPGMRDSVASQLARIRQVCLPTKGATGSYEGHLLNISWGRMDWLGEPYCVAYGISMGVDYTLFDRSGRPMRATVRLELKVQPATEGHSSQLSGIRPKRVINNLRDKLGI